MSDSLSVCKKNCLHFSFTCSSLVFAIALFPIFANVWISFKDIELKDIRIPEPGQRKLLNQFQKINQN